MSVVAKPKQGSSIIVNGQAEDTLQTFFDDLEQAASRTFTVAPMAGFQKANLPDAADGYGWIQVTDELGGTTPAYSDLTNWRRLDGSIIS